MNEIKVPNAGSHTEAATIYAKTLSRRARKSGEFRDDGSPMGVWRFQLIGGSVLLESFFQDGDFWIRLALEGDSR